MKEKDSTQTKTEKEWFKVRPLQQNGLWFPMFIKQNVLVNVIASY